MRWQEQKAYFDYHVGNEFVEKKYFFVSGRKMEVEFNPIDRFFSLSAKFNKYLRKK